MSRPIDAVLAHADADLDGSLGRLFDFLRIPSISTDPAYKDECLRAAGWAADRLAECGFRAEIRPTAGHPMVVAHHDGAGPDAPHVLYYGHYDVQPPEPLDLWHTGPFEPTLVDGPHGKRIVARGAVDDKGQVMMFFEAFRAWHAVHGNLPCRVTVFLEGEEECGSPSLVPFLEANRAELSEPDIAVVCDTGMWDVDTPAITTMLRGMAYTEVKLTGPSRDLHSGLYGGSALNPINALAKILGDLTDDAGRIQLPGFYDNIPERSMEQKAEWEALGFDEAAFLADVGLSAPSGEAQRSGLERLWARPTADINGIWGGYTGPGSKTVIASEAFAKVSFRLVTGQDPDQVVRAFQQFCDDRAPAGARVEVSDLHGAPAMEVPLDLPELQAARAALADEFGRPAVTVGSGGSIPVVEKMKRILGLDSVLMGFGLNDDQIHSPNEKFEQVCFHHGLRSNARLLAKLAEAAGA
ncbi:MAG: M20/M25/M40 family metallo-hydrolase [Alphaproteobacteria bacterium]|nr:M20/M25/M40 family metallo-hydrolase [Alphaproteobacteria bacterium]MCB9929833.1 M20/M25/M40 family metallo-hydrolase [Alphaproteobacteria bacterium]